MAIACQLESKKCMQRYVANKKDTMVKSAMVHGEIIMISKSYQSAHQTLKAPKRISFILKKNNHGGA